MSEVERILIILHGSAAVVVQSLGAVAAIRRHHDKAVITLLVEKNCAELLVSCKDVDLMKIDRMPFFFNISDAKRMWSWFRDSKFDQVFDLTVTKRTGWYFRLIGRTKPSWNGGVVWCSQPYLNPRARGLHVVDRLREQLREAHIMRTPEPKIDWLKAEKVVGAPRKNRYVLMLLDYEPDAPHWHAYGFADVADWLDEQGLQVVLAWRDGRRAKLAKQIVTMCRQAKPVVMAELSVAQVVGLGEGAKLVVGHHQVMLHVLAMRGVVSVMLATDRQPINLEAPRNDALVALTHATLDVLDGEDVVGVLRDLLGEGSR